MSKKQRIGSDPFSWIKDSRTEESQDSGAHSASDGAPQSDGVLSTDAPTTRQGLRAGWKRHTFIVREQHLEKIQAVAYWERRDIKEVVDEALDHYLREKEVPALPR